MDDEGRRMKFRAFVRVRPVPGDSPNGVVQPEHRVLYLKDAAKSTTSEFVFDRVFDATARQEAVFSEVAAPLVEHVLQGYNACALAYGQTGAGKTHTMFGGEAGQPGLAPRAAEALVRAAQAVNAKGGSTQLRVFASFLEINLEQVRDLLAGIAPASAASYGPGGAAAGSSFSGFPSLSAGMDGTASFSGGFGGANDSAGSGSAAGGLEVKEDASGVTFVKDLTFVEVASPEQAAALLAAGASARASGSSPRSSAVLTLSVVQARRSGGGAPITGRLSLVDLAGSERSSATAGNTAAKEARSASASLAALGRALAALAKQGESASAKAEAGRINFKDHKITRLLKDALTGNSVTSLLACVHPTPDNADETAATLQFAARCADAPAASAPTASVVPAPPSPRAASASAAAAALAEDLRMEVAQLKEELECTHTHYQKLLEGVGPGGWGRGDPGPVERAPGGGGGFGDTWGGGGGGGADSAAGGATPGNMSERTGRVTISNGQQRPATAASGSGGTRGGSGASASGGSASAATNMKVSQLEAQVRRLETQLQNARSSTSQYEERLHAKHGEMDALRERQAAKEHAQFAEIKRLRAALAEAQATLGAERTDAAARLDDAKRRGEEEAARLLRDVETLRGQLAQVTGSVAAVVEKQSHTVGAERRAKEKLRSEMDRLLREQAAAAAEEHRASLANIKEQSAFFLARQSEALHAARAEAEAARTAAAAQAAALTAELDYLAAYAERVTETLRRMEAGVVPVQDKAGGVKVFKLPAREQPPRLESARLGALRARAAEAADRLTALSDATAAAAALLPAGHASTSAALRASATSLSLGSPRGVASGGGAAAAAPAAAGAAAAPPPPAPAVDLEALRKGWESEMRATITAQVLSDLKSEATVEYIRNLESQVARYRGEVQAEKRRGSEQTVALRSVQRVLSARDSPVQRALAAYTPAGTLSRDPAWGLGHRPGSAGMAGSLSVGSSPRPGFMQSRPATASAYSALTASYRERGLEVPQ